MALVEIRAEGEKKLPLWEFVFVVALLAIYLLPSVSIGTTIILAVILAYCGYLAFSDKNLLPTIVATMSLICILAFFYALLTDASSIAQNVSNRELKRFVSKVYQYTTIYFPAILYIRVHKTATKSQKRFLVVAGMLLMLYVIVTTWVFLDSNPDATREWESFDETASQGVANYYFIYAVPIIVSVFSIVLFRANGAMRLLSIGLIIAGILFLVKAQYTLSILITIIGVLIQIFRNLRSAASKMIFVFTIALISIYLPSVLEWAIYNIPSDQVTTRLSEIYAFLTGSGELGYNLGGRLTLYGDTVKAFLESPIWGNINLTFDGHATFLTVLSDTGLLGSIPFYALLSMVYKSIKSYMHETHNQFNVILIMFVMMGLTNPIHASLPLGLAVWFLAPLTIQMIMKEDYNNETPLEN